MSGFPSVFLAVSAYLAEIARLGRIPFKRAEEKGGFCRQNK
jgi:hypothetical protein